MATNIVASKGNVIIVNNKATNIQKYENYREQFVRLKKALDSKFFLEAIS